MLWHFTYLQAGYRHVIEGLYTCCNSSNSVNSYNFQRTVFVLDCIEACVRQNDLFRLAVTSTPLVAATQVHAEMLAKIDENVKNLRARLLAASEAVEACSRCRVDRVQFQSLNLMELAAQQRRMIHRDLGNFYTVENSSWLIETRIKPQQNCMNKEMQYRKCLLSHRQLELLLETLSETMMKEYKEIAFDLRSLQREVLPSKLTCAKRHQQAKQHQNEDLGLDVYEFASDSVLLVKALEVGYLLDIDKATRLQTVTGAWQKLLSVMSVGEIVHSLKQGLLTLLQHLRTMDVDRHFCDRTSEELASKNYDIWVWMTKVTPWAGTAFGLQMWTCGPGGYVYSCVFCSCSQYPKDSTCVFDMSSGCMLPVRRSNQTADVCEKQTLQRQRSHGKEIMAIWCHELGWHSEVA